MAVEVAKSSASSAANRSARRKSADIGNSGIGLLTPTVVHHVQAETVRFLQAGEQDSHFFVRAEAWWEILRFSTERSLRGGVPGERAGYGYGAAVRTGSPSTVQTTTS